MKIKNSVGSVLFFACTLAVAFPSPESASSAARQGFTKLFIRKTASPSQNSTGSAQIAGSVLSSGGLVIDETTGYIVAYVPNQAAGQLVKTLAALTEGVEVRDDFDVMKFACLPIDARVGEPPYPPGLSRTAPLPAPARDAFVIQFAAPPHKEWMDMVAASGAVIVDYIPENAYVIIATAETVAGLAQILPIQYSAVQQPYHKISSELLDEKSAFVDVTISVLDIPESVDALALLASNTAAQLGPPENVGDRTFHRVTLPPNALPILAGLPAVAWIEVLHPLLPSGEREAHLVAGDTLATTSSPFKPIPGNYTTWITNKGIGNYKTAVKVGTVDTGFDTTLAPLPPPFKDFLSHTNTPFVTVLNETVYGSTTDDCYGHGTMTAGILAGNAGDTYSTSIRDIGSTYGDATYLMGQGVAPGVPLTVAKVVDYEPSSACVYCPKPWKTVYGDLTSRGISVVNQSLNNYTSTPSYDTDAQTLDKVVRHANGSDSGPGVVTFVSTGNRDKTSYVHVMSPATAKNVIGVGASESYNPIPSPPYPLPFFADDSQGTCIPIPIDMTGVNADNGYDIWQHSCYGPTSDGRVKPDVVAPGTAVEAPRTRDPYNETASCSGRAGCIDRIGGIIDTSDTKQEHYWSRGTSFAAPAAAGAGVLLSTWFKNQTGSLPSPAMLKALEVAFAKDLYPGGRSPSPSVAHSPDAYQGWGKVDLTNAFKTDGRYLWADQNFVITPGSLGYQPQNYIIKDISRVVTVVLAWTDYPGATGTGTELVNDLDLEACPQGHCGLSVQMHGNIFNSNGHSTVGVNLPFDHKNNVEVIRFTSAEIGSTVFSVKVLYTAIAANCFTVWGSPDPNFQQDFALFIDNAITQ